MKISEKVFQDTCQKLSQDFFKYMKKKIIKELNILSNGNAKVIDVNETISITIHCLGIADGNIINMCRDIYKGIKGQEINIEKLLELHQIVINQILNLHKCNQKLN